MSGAAPARGLIALAVLAGLGGLAVATGLGYATFEEWRWQHGVRLRSTVLERRSPHTLLCQLPSPHPSAALPLEVSASVFARTRVGDSLTVEYDPSLAARIRRAPRSQVPHRVRRWALLGVAVIALAFAVVTPTFLLRLRSN